MLKCPTFYAKAKRHQKNLSPVVFADKKVCNRVRKALPELLFEMKRLQNIAIIQYLTYTDFTTNTDFSTINSLIC